MKLYQDVFKQAWRHTIQRPGLWIFGFFAVFVFGAAGEIDRYFRFLNASLTDGHFTNPGTWANGEWVDLLGKLSTVLRDGNISVWILSLLVLLAGIVVIMMIAISIGALIHSSIHGTESFSEAFTAGKKHWLQLTALFVPTYLLTVALVLSLAAGITQLPGLATESAGQLVWMIVGGVVLVPFVIAASLLVRYAALAIVVEDKHLGQALVRAWQLLSHHWLISFEMALVNFVMVTAINLAILIALVLMFIPVFLTISFSELAGILIIGQVLYAGLSLFTSAILSTWQWSAWTVLFQTLQQEKPTSTLVRWAKTIA